MRQKKLVFICLMIFALCACASADVKITASEPANTAYDFTLSDQDGKMWKLSDVVKDYRAVVLAFYPKDDTKL
jgi:hypothetical protein